MRVSKNDDQTDIQPLNHDECIEELARMLAGADVNSKAQLRPRAVVQAVSAPTINLINPTALALVTPMRVGSIRAMRI